MARLVAALLALLVLAPSARADGRLVHAFDADGDIQSTGNGFAWTTDDGRARVTDAFGRTLHDVAGCRSVGASAAGVALLACAGGTQLLDTRTGALRAQPLDGAPVAIGRHWIESLHPSSGCAGCEYPVYVNWRTGEVRQGGSDSAKRMRLDLDDPALGVWRRGVRVVGASVFARDPAELWRRVARCRVACGAVERSAGRVAYVDAGRRRLVDRDLTTRATRRWRLPRGRLQAILRAGRDLVVVDRTGRVWRAKR